MSLSGWTGVMAGIYSLLGALAAYYVIFKVKSNVDAVHTPVGTYNSENYVRYNYGDVWSDLFTEKNIFLIMIAVAVILLSAVTAFYQSSVKCKQNGVKLWNSTTKRLFVQVSIPLISGGIFSIALLFYGHAGLIAPAMLIFYGLALLNGSKYSLKEFHSLALCEIGLGIVSLLFIGCGLIFWTIGFGVLHIFYGILMQKRYS